jgi:hypothetical protein
VKGIIIPVFGERAEKEAREAIEQIVSVWPDVSTKLYIYPKLQPTMLVKVLGFQDSPFDRSLLLDADTWMVEPVPELFDILDHFDIALAHAPWREVYDVGVPLAFPEHNIGVVAYKKSEAFDTFVETWKEQFIEDSVKRSHERVVSWFPSQASFRRALYQSDLRICTLPPEYNWRGTGYAHHPVKIVHKRPAREREALRINAVEGPRIATLGRILEV